jgi:uncharacterized protein YwlG (UPF0340 family)
MAADVHGLTIVEAHSMVVLGNMCSEVAGTKIEAEGLKGRSLIVLNFEADT